MTSWATNRLLDGYNIFNMWTLNRFIVYFSTMIISVSVKYFFMFVHNPVRFLLWWPRNATHGKMRTRNTSGVGSSVAALDVGIISHLLARTQPCHRKCLFLPHCFYLCISVSKSKFLQFNAHSENIY